MRDLTQSCLVMKVQRFLFLFGAFFALSFYNAPAAEPDSNTPKKPVTDEYQGVKVEDPYQWLNSPRNANVFANSRFRGW